MFSLSELVVPLFRRVMKSDLHCKGMNTCSDEDGSVVVKAGFCVGQPWKKDEEL